MKDTKVSFPSKKDAKFVLCGSGLVMCRFAEKIVNRGFKKPLIITHPKEEHKRDKSLFDNERCREAYRSIFSCANNLSIKVKETKNANSSDTLDWIRGNGGNIALSFGSRSIFESSFIGVFDGLVLNVHSTDLPRYRGAATYTWLVLRDESHVFGTVHMINKGVDSGDILVKIKKSRESERPYPIDFMRETQEMSMRALDRLIKAIEKGKSLYRKSQDLSEGTYFPRLKTEKNGAIDWRWGSQNIERFIRAFSWPYPGAFTFYKGDKIYITDAKTIDTKKNTHPFLRGLITSKNKDGSVSVFAGGGGMVKVDSIRKNGSRDPASEVLSVGKRVLTPSNKIHESLSYKASY